MRSVFIKITMGFVLAFGSYSAVRAQYLLKNKLLLSLDYGYAKGINASDIESGNMIIPSVLKYMKSGPGGSFSLKYLLKNTAGISLGASSFQFSEWTGTEYSDIYENAEMRITSLKPGIFLCNPYRDTGIFNRLGFNLTIGPAVEFTKLNPGKSFPWFYPPDGKPFSDEIKDNAFGIFTALSVHYAIAQLVDFRLSYEINKYWGSNALISGNGICLQYFGAGIRFRFITEKYYLYE